MSKQTDYKLICLNLQYVNNSCVGHPANVAYLELDLPNSFPLHLRKFIPNIHFASAAQDGIRQIRVVALGAYSRGIYYAVRSFPGEQRCGGRGDAIIRPLIPFLMQSNFLLFSFPPLNFSPLNLNFSFFPLV